MRRQSHRLGVLSKPLNKQSGGCGESSIHQCVRSCICGAGCVQVMSEDARQDYDLEGLWGEGGEMDESRQRADEVPEEDEASTDEEAVTTKAGAKKRRETTYEERVKRREAKYAALGAELEWDERPAGPAERRRASG